MTGEGPSESRRLSREQLRAEFGRARERIDDLEVDRRRSHGRLIDSLAEHMYDGFVLLSLEGVHLDVNTAFCAMTGFSREELVGGGMPYPYWPPEAREQIVRVLRHNLEEPTGPSEVIFMRKNGARFPVLITPTMMRDETGDPICVFAIVGDVSEQRRAEAALRVSEARYAKAQAIGRVGSWEYDVKTTRFWGSAEARRIYGLDPDAPTFSTEEVEATTTDRERVHQALVDLINEGRAFDLEYEIFPKGSLEPRILWSVAEVQRDEHSDPLTVTGVVQDVTERRRADDDRRESEARYRSLFEDSPVAMWEEDYSAVKARLEELAAAGIDDVIAYVLADSQEYARCVELVRGVDANNAAVRLFEAASVEELLTHNSDLYRRESDRGIYHLWAAMLAGERSVTFEEANLSLSGRQLHVLETCTVVPGHERTFDRVYIANVDITERIQTEEALQHSSALLSQGESMAHLGSWEWDIASDACAVSAEWQRLHGLTGERFSNADILLTCHEDDREAMQAALARAAAGEPYRVDHRLVRPGTGEVRHLMTYGEPLFDPDGQLKTVIGASLDVTARVHADEVLREREQRLQGALADTVAALGATVAMRDPYTASHERRVSGLACSIAARLGWSAEAIEKLRMAALVHDVGKIAIPAEILSKPTRLTETEFELVKAHATAAYEILAPIDFGGPVAEIVAQHHERLDGSGYPCGLCGDEILPGARVLAVADVVEAMITHRPYRAALPVAEALAEIGPQSRGRYDAEAAGVCRRLFEEEGFTLPE